MLAFQQSAYNFDENDLNNFFAEILEKENTKNRRKETYKIIIP